MSGNLLFNLEEDPTETTDLAALPAYADVLKNLTTTLTAFQVGMQLAVIITHSVAVNAFWPREFVKGDLVK